LFSSFLSFHSSDSGIFLRVGDLKRERQQLTQEIERLRAQLENAERASGSAIAERFEAQLQSLRADNQTLQQNIE
jgi:hypothetical protein